jgi:ssDNA-binding Zn-finger/Zn-ribbon topoisomerase 1
MWRNGTAGPPQPLHRMEAAADGDGESQRVHRRLPSCTTTTTCTYTYTKKPSHKVVSRTRCPACPPLLEATTAAIYLEAATIYKVEVVKRVGQNKMTARLAECPGHV